MSLKKIHNTQPDNFIFSEKNLKIAQGILKKYPENKKKKCCDATPIFSTKTKSKLDPSISYEIYS